jgi:hypothetical protein
MENFGDYSVAIFTDNESIAAYAVSVNAPFEHNGTIMKTGLYVTNCASPILGSLNADITIEKVVS